VDKKIITIGFEIPGYSELHIPLRSDQSVLDYDVVVFQPDISKFLGLYVNHYLGKPSLLESSAFQLREAASRWRDALREALSHGKTIFVFMPRIEEVFLDTGRREYSGTGRNRQTTNIVEEFINYSMLPLKFTELAAAHGKEIKPAGDLKTLANYWANFADSSEYEVYFDCQDVVPLLVTRTGNKIVGGIIRERTGTTGALVLLPVLHYDRSKFIGKKENKRYWNEEGLTFGEKLRNSLLEIDRALAASRELTPPPEWTRNPQYRLSSESSLEGSISELTKQIERLQSQRSEFSRQLENVGSLRRLLFEKGHGLEDAILEALTIIGLKPERFRDSESEFDAVFVWNEQRFLGEAEGKDNKPVAIDKMSQLERNLSEDFSREDVKDHAKGILFGNAFRLQPPSEREAFFTEKCLSAAKRIRAALVKTPDLFLAAKYVKESGDTDYAARCIDAIVRAEGVAVEFPARPLTEESVSIRKAEKESTKN
jgi:hypothetical protein